MVHPHVSFKGTNETPQVRDSSATEELTRTKGLAFCPKMKERDELMEIPRDRTERKIENKHDIEQTMRLSVKALFGSTALGSKRHRP